MSDILYIGLRFGFLMLLWLLIFAALATMRRDMQVTAKKPNGRLRVSEEHVVNNAPRAVPRGIHVTYEDGTTKTHPLSDSPFIIGRGTNANLVLTDNFASTKHARLYYNNGVWYIEDMGSTNGTLIAGKKLTTAQPVSIGSKITIGQTTLEII